MAARTGDSSPYYAIAIRALPREVLKIMPAPSSATQTRRVTGKLRALELQSGGKLQQGRGARTKPRFSALYLPGVP